MKKLLSGNEAIALGAYHAGVSVASAYPGTPSTEIMENLAKLEGIHAEWAPNEAVALEVAVGAAFGGVRAMASMKHVGLNVAADPFFAVAYTGIEGGLVVISADDPGMHSSQNEQDNRHYARAAKVPMLEPSDSQEAFDLMAIAFDISEQYDTPVMVRTTTRIAHANTVVELPEGERRPRNKPRYTKNAGKYVMVPAGARRRHPVVEERMRKLVDYSDTFPLNKITIQDRQLGIIANGVAYQYAREVFPNASFLKLTMTNPLPKKLIAEFAGQVEKLVVIEELDPFIEDQVKAMGYKVIGKDVFPIIGEFSPELVEAAAIKAGLLPAREEQAAPALPKLAARPPQLCPACTHLGVFYTLGRMGFVGYEEDGNGEKKAKRFPLIVAGDIGCYTLGFAPPLNGIDSCGCMGASIGNAVGLYRAGVANKVVAVIGDSTFFHTGVQGIIEMVYNNAPVTVCILDNRVTAMTGHQGNPGSGLTARGEPAKIIDIAELVKALGVEDVHVVDAYDVKTVESTIKAAVQNDVPSVVVVRRPCPLYAKYQDAQPHVDVTLCTGCRACLKLGCPAMILKDGKAFVDPAFCRGCMMCQQLCNQGAIVR